MSGEFIDWDSQSLAHWTWKCAAGKTVALAGCQTHYLVAGSGAPLILIHGFFFDSSLWLDNIGAFANHYRVYALDLWGFGYSCRDRVSPNYQLYTDQLIAFMDHLGIDKAIVIGQSLGAGVAMHLSVHHPERVEKLVLVAAAGLPNPEQLSAKLFMLPGIGEFLLKRPTDFIRRKMLKDFFLYKADSVSADQYQKLMQFQKIEGTVAFMLRLMRHRFADKLQQVIEQLASLDIPIQIVWGRKDRSISLTLGRQLHALLPGSSFTIIDQAGHVPNLEQSAIFNSSVLNFLDGHVANNSSIQAEINQG